MTALTLQARIVDFSQNQVFRRCIATTGKHDANQNRKIRIRGVIKAPITSN